MLAQAERMSDTARPSMGQDMIKGRRTEIEFLNGLVVQRAKEFGIDGDSVFPIPEWVGGRFSLWGSAGLIIAISIGSENYRELLNGANSMDKHFRESNFENNYTLQYLHYLLIYLSLQRDFQS